MAVIYILCCIDGVHCGTQALIPIPRDWQEFIHGPEDIYLDSVTFLRVASSTYTDWFSLIFVQGIIWKTLIHCLQDLLLPFNTILYLRVLCFLNKMFKSPEFPNKPLPFIPLYILSWEFHYLNVSYRSLVFLLEHCFPSLCSHFRFSFIFFFCHQDHNLSCLLLNCNSVDHIS